MIQNAVPRRRVQRRHRQTVILGQLGKFLVSGLNFIQAEQRTQAARPMQLFATFEGFRIFNK